MQLHSETAGTGASIVLLHGWAMNLGVFDELVAALAQRNRVTAIDLPGHGRSPWRDALTPAATAEWLLEQLPEHCTLVGWSLGGQLAMRLAALAPQRILRLVLIASTPKFVAATDWPHGLAPETLRHFAADLETDGARCVDEFLQLQVRGSSAAQRTLQMLRDGLQRHGVATPAALRTGLEQLANEDLRALARTLTLPVLLISGRNDRVTPPDATRALAGMLGDARLVELRRAAHAPFLSHPDELLAALRAFLGGRAAAEAAA